MTTNDNDNHWEQFDGDSHTMDGGERFSSYSEFYGVVGEIIRPRFDTLQGAVPAAQWGEGQVRQDFLRAARLADELGDWDLNAHFSQRNGRIEELTALLDSLEELSNLDDGESMDIKTVSSDSRSLVAALQTYKGDERMIEVGLARVDAVLEIRQLQKEIAYARENGCFEDYSHVTDMFEKENDFSVGKRQQIIPFWHRQLISLCRVTEDGTKNNHEEAALARLIAYGNRDDMESQRRVQPRRRSSSSRGGSVDTDEY